MCSTMILMKIISIMFIALKESKAVTTNIYVEGDMILGPGNIEVKCLVHNPANVRILTTSIDAFIDKRFKAIAYFYLPNLPNGDINATLSTVGNYLANRVILTNPESPDDNNMYEASMTIINVTCEDETQYQCNVLFEGDNVLSNDTTFVLKDIPKKPDRIPSRDPDSVLCPGMNVSFTCVGNIGRPPGNFKWTKFSNGSYTEYITDTIAEALPGTCRYFGTSTLSIEGQKEDNGAIFKCEIVHELATNDTYQQTLPEDFIYDPIQNLEITKEPYKIVYDQMIPFIDLTCSFNGCRHPTFTWYKDTDLNTTIGNESLYRISDVLEANSGTYICQIQVVDNGIEYNQTDRIYIEIRHSTENDKKFPETVVGIVTITLASVATTAVTSFALFKIFQKSRHLRMLNTIHAQDVEPVVKSSEQNTETTPNMDDEGFQSEVSQQWQNRAPVQTGM